MNSSLSRMLRLSASGMGRFRPVAPAGRFPTEQPDMLA